MGLINEGEDGDKNLEELVRDFGALKNSRSGVRVNPVLEKAIQKAVDSVTPTGEDDGDGLGTSSPDLLDQG